MLWIIAQWVILALGWFVFLFLLDVTMVMKFVVELVERHPWWGLLAGIVMGGMASIVGLLWLSAGMPSPHFDWRTPLTWPWLATAALFAAGVMLRITYEWEHEADDVWCRQCGRRVLEAGQTT